MAMKELAELARLIEETPRDRQTVCKIIGYDFAEDIWRYESTVKVLVDFARRILAEKLALSLEKLFEEGEVDDRLFDEATDLTEDIEVETMLYRFRNAIIIKSGDMLHILVMRSENEARKVVEKAKEIAEGFEHADFPTEHFCRYYSQHAVHYSKAVV